MLKENAVTKDHTSFFPVILSLKMINRLSIDNKI